MNKPLSGMLPPKLGITLAGLLAFTVSSHADTFGTGANTFTIEFVDISGGETADNTGFGAVAHDYRMGKYEVSGGMIDAYNADSGGPAITRLTEWSGSQPATGISWNEAARFVNWLNTSSGYSVAYKFTTDGGNDNIALWGAGDAGYNPANPFRNSNAYYVLPSEDEWYRAAYYDPNAGVYWDYETGSDTKPTAVEGGTSAGTAVYKTQAFLAMDPADITNAGGLSPFGTMAQGGNAWEWVEWHPSWVTEGADSRVRRGGSWDPFPTQSVGASNRFINNEPAREGFFDGFRVASVTGVVPARTVSAIDPASGSTAGGTRVTITGTGFTGATAVSIGGNPATDVSVVDATTITAITPAGTAGTASVVVTTPGGASAANTLYTYLAPPSLPLVITGVRYDPGAHAVTLTWHNSGASSYAARYSFDMTNWEGSLADGLTDALDEVPADGEQITVTLALTGVVSQDEPAVFLRIEEVEVPTNVVPVANMVFIAPGKFIMGSPGDEQGRDTWEGPQTEVTISRGFWLGAFEVTQAEYLEVVGSNPSTWRNGASYLSVYGWDEAVGGPVTNEARHPVDSMTWLQATNYCALLTTRERAAGRLPSGWRYQLPTEAQWEYACRAGTSTPFVYGEALRSGMENFDGRYELPGCPPDGFICYNPNGIFLGRTAEVGSYQPNAWGLYDMHGNVREWCQDFRSFSLPGGSVVDPQGSPTGTFRVIRGGAFRSDARGCRSASRTWSTPDEEGITINTGFRVALVPVP